MFQHMPKLDFCQPRVNFFYSVFRKKYNNTKTERGQYCAVFTAMIIYEGKKLLQKYGKR